MPLSGPITNGDDIVTITGTEGDLDFLGGNDVVDTSGVVTIASITMGAGSDSLTLDNQVEVTGNISLGSSNVSANTSSNGPPSQLTLNGFDNIGGSIFGSRGQEIINLSGAVTVNDIDLGNNADVIDASSSSFTATSILMGRGSDQLTLDSDDVVTGVISMGASLTGPSRPGTNTLTLDGYDAQAIIFGGSGIDNVNLSGDVSLTSMDLGAGDDVIDGSLLTSISGSFIDLGDGNNIANFNDVTNLNLGGDVFSIFSGGGNDQITGTAGTDFISSGIGADIVTGGDGADEFVYTLAPTSDLTITDFGVGNTGAIDDGDPFNNDFLDLGSIYDSNALALANAELALAGNDTFTFVQGVFLADLADGVLDGISTVAGEEFDISDDLFGDGMGGADRGSITFTVVPTVTRASIIEQFNVLCFAHGTLIKTASGEVPVETLSPGDMVLTKDHGYQTLRWIGERELGGQRLLQHSNLKPILIKKGALGEGFPAQDLKVSPQHRICLRSPIVHRLFGEYEAFVPACKLTKLDGISVQKDARCVRYFHLLFDQHELVMSNGTWTESLFLGPQSEKTLTEDQLREVGVLFPELLYGIENNESPFPLRRMAVQKQKYIDKLIDRSIKNQKSVYMGA